MQRGGELAAQALAGHLEDIVDAHRAWAGLEKHAGAAVQIEDVAVGIDQRADGDDLCKQGPLGHLAQGLSLAGGRRGGAAERGGLGGGIHDHGG
jgi:hypothetical protein